MSVIFLPTVTNTGALADMRYLSIISRNAIGRMESKLRETCAAVKRVEEVLPQNLGYPWVWDHKVIYLDDVLGRLIPIPFDLCYEGM